VGVGEFAHHPVGKPLHPGLEGVRTAELALRVGVERGDRLGDRRPGHDRVRDLRHLLLDPRKLLEAPAVGLVEIDGSTEEEA
jgi:hypothetical protein